MIGKSRAPHRRFGGDGPRSPRIPRRAESHSTSAAATNRYPVGMTAIDLESRYSARNYEPLPVVLARGEGAYLWDVSGRRYVDMMSAYSAASHGHAHPRILAALTAQAARLAVPSRAYYNDRLGPFLAELCGLTGLDAALPMNTGAEAVETAIKAARRWGYRVKGIPPDRAEIIVAHGNFHGRTTTIVGFSSEPDYRDGFGPFAPGFRSVRFGDLAALERAITPETAAVLIEPIQGEAGIVVPPRGWLAGVRRLCDAHDVLLILDEVQSGLGRTGRWFAYEHEGVRPDGLVLGKALGGGILPVSAFVGRRELMDVFTPGSHGSTSAAIRWPRQSASRPFMSCATKGWWSAAGGSAPTCSSACAPCARPPCWTCAGSACGPASSSIRAPRPRAWPASGCWRRACCPRRRTPPWFASRRPSSLRATISIGRSTASRRSCAISTMPGRARRPRQSRRNEHGDRQETGL